MFSFDLPDSNVALLFAVLNTLIILGVFLLMSVSYTSKRAGQSYATNKQKAPSVSSFKTLSKALFVTSMLITMASFWLSSPLFIALHNHIGVQTMGVLIVLIGYLNLRRAFATLDNNYSPLFDAYQPFQLVTHGIYQKIRHPIYLFNLFVSFGLAIASGSLLVLACANTGLFFVLKAIQLEEHYLAEAFSDYVPYKKKTWKLIPFIF